MNQHNVVDCYNKTAENYAAKFQDELNNKHLDKILLQSFAIENRNRGKLIDLGCGPGQTTKYLAGCGVTDIIGIDIAPGMVAIAKKNHTGLHFETADILSLEYPDSTFGSAIAFYSIVHFDYNGIKTAFNEIRRVLKEGGEFLSSFHVGTEVIHLDNFLDHPVKIDFNFFETMKIKALVVESGFEIVDIIERQPYPDIEYQSTRAYIWVRKS